MRQALYRVGTSGIALSAALVGCSLFSKEETAPIDSAALGGQNSGAGFTGVNLSGGASSRGGSTGAGNASGTGNTGNTGASGATSVPQECQDLAAQFALCGGAKQEADFKTVNILLVIDKSGSMQTVPSGFTTTKWANLQTALKQVLPTVQNDINFGMILYPYSNALAIPLDNCGDSCCTVEGGTAAVNVNIGAGSTTVPQILQKLQDGRQAPGGGTPTAAALRSAYDYFTTGDGATLQGDKFVLLATDGGPNCDVTNTCGADRCTPILDGQITQQAYCTGRGEYCLDDASVVSQIQLLKAKGIDTFVIGIPGTEVYASYLDTFAEAGGRTDPSPTTPGRKFYEVKTPEALATAFSSITTQLVRSCDIALATEPPDPTLVNIAIDCNTVPFNDGAGWELDLASTPKILRIKGDRCANIQATGAKRVDVFYNCPSIR